ncbi:MAG: DUF5698 domain-containing protein [Oscillospiraceae bacterium]
MSVFVICLQIFFCRIVDVTLATVRTVLTVKEKPGYAAMMGFVEALMWFLVVREALTVDGNGLPTAIAYAAGFATGTFTGGLVSHRFIKGNITCQIVTTNKNNALVSAIRAEGYGVSVIDVNESEFCGEKYMLFCEIPNRRLEELKKLVRKFDEKAFIMVQETKYVYNGFIKK